MSGDAHFASDLQNELARVAVSVTFARAIKQRELLTWLVRQAVDGKDDSFSQYSIATGALGYPSQFDATADSTVRTAIKRLRERLTLYYQHEGRLNRFRIQLDEGQYRPRLVSAEIEPTPSPVLNSLSNSTSKIAVLVLPFLPIDFRDPNYVCQGLTLNVMRALSASGQARIVPWSTSHWLVSKTGDKREYHRFTAADVILEGLVRSEKGGGFGVSVQWIDGLTGLFDCYVETRGSSADTLNLADHLASQLADRLKVTYDERTRMQVAVRQSSSAPAAALYLKAREASLNLSPYGVERGFKLVNKALKLDPYFAAAHALMSELHLGVAEAGMSPAGVHAPLAREYAQKALSLAPDLGEALAARGGVEFTYDWDLPLAKETMTLACSDLLAEGAMQWPPWIELAGGEAENAALSLERWAQLDPGSSGKAGQACAMWYYARQFDRTIAWGMRALELDPLNLRTGAMVAAAYAGLHRHEESVDFAYRLSVLAPDSPEVNLSMAGLLAQAGRRSDAERIIKHWETQQGSRYISPLPFVIGYAWLGETSLALEALQNMVEDRQCPCLFARQAPYFAPLHGLPEFERVLNNAGIAA
jgi:TolB-like protein